jgi:hypothetical protein
MMDTEEKFLGRDSEMSILIAIALLLTGAGGYISSSLKEEKTSKRNGRPGIQTAENSNEEPELFNMKDAITGQFGAIGQQTGGPALLSGQRQYTCATKSNSQGQPELLGHKDFEAKRKTA